MSGALTRRKGDGSHTLIIRDEREGNDHRLFQPAIRLLQEAIEKLGGPQDPRDVLDNVLDVLKFASKELREIEPMFEGEARDEARILVSKAMRELRKLESDFAAAGR